MPTTVQGRSTDLPFRLPEKDDNRMDIRRVRIIANPIAGQGRACRDAERLAVELERLGVEADLFITRGAGDARREAAAEGFDCIVSVGGDGSTNEVANGIGMQDRAIAVLAHGTANVVARELGLPKRPKALAALIAQGATRLNDAGRVNGERFVLSVGAGLDAAVVHEVGRRRKGTLSYASYVLPVLHTLRTYAFPKIRVIAGGQVLCEDADYALAAKRRHSAGVVPLTPKAREDDGALEVIAFRNLTIPRALAIVGGAFLGGRHLGRGDVCYAKAAEARFESASGEPVPVQIDGDPGGFLPVDLSVEPGALRMVAPGPKD